MRRLEQLFAVRRKEGFVGGDHGLSALQSAEHDFAGGRGAAHQFHDEVDLRVIDDLGVVRAQERRGNLDRARLVEITHHHFCDMEPDAETGGNERAITLNGPKHAAADGAAADNAQIHLLHKGGKTAVIRRGRQSFLDTKGAGARVS